MAVAQAFFLRRQLHGFEIGRTLKAVAGILVASALLGVVSYEVWNVLEQALGLSLLAQLVSVLSAMVLGSAVYAAAVIALRIPEAQQIIGLLRSRMRREAS